MDNQAFVSELSKLRSSSTFLSLVGYHNEHSEVANFSIVFHMSYENALKRSIQTLEELTLTTALEFQAREELLGSFHHSLIKLAENGVEELDHGYTRFFDDDGDPIKGVKLHTATDTLHLYGLVVHKKILVEGSYPQQNKRPLTVAKEKMRYLTPIGKFRQFKIIPNRVERISVENLTLLPSN